MVALLIWWLTAYSCEAQTPYVDNAADALSICNTMAAKVRPQLNHPGEGAECVTYAN